jgi:hypothetical protein
VPVRTCLSGDSGSISRSAANYLDFEIDPDVGRAIRGDVASRPVGAAPQFDAGANPSSFPSPIPGSMSLSAGVSRTLPLFLKFGCGVPPIGTLVVSIDTVGGRGTVSASRVSVNAGG